MNVLIAEDDPTARAVLAAAFKKLGHTPKLALDGAQALEEAFKEPYPEIIVLDWVMPGMSGLDITKHIREKAETLPFRPYIIILTAKKEKHEVAQALNEGADDFISKPPNVVELMARLQVAARLLEHEIELQTTIKNLRLMVKKYGTANKDETQETTSPTGATKTETQILIAKALEESKISAAPIKLEPTLENPILIWDTILLPKLEVWIEIIIGMSKKTAHKIFAHIQEKELGKEPPSKTEIEKIFAGITNNIRKTTQSRLQEIGVETTFPFTFTQKFGGMKKREDSQDYFYCTPQGPIHVNVNYTRCPKRAKPLQAVNTLELLPEGYPHNSPAKIINAGTVVDQNLKQTIRQYAKARSNLSDVIVIEPTETTKWFHNL